MMLDWFWGLAGGLMIGSAGSVFLLYNGRVMGASGIIGGLVDGTGWSNWAERLVFLVGLVGVPYLLWLVIGGETHLTTNWFVIMLAGLLVGIGARLAGGCTSGHGVCGISRLSLRSIVATLIYVLAGGLTIALLRHLLGVI
ncbi:YeeE/YedE thiosulfate transporter family protein [Cypionkella sp.]|uniref:YeeE/YedE family protein n=1 Tax=Cypionkella sp. TaxID=2811411 RepID=UPI00262EA089|nr:YeeE/YedE thiosulfate transporter family protein [Cypionkella sp.]